MDVVGTIVPKDKGAREKLSIPFIKLLKVETNDVAEGWYREAIINMKTIHSKLYYIQCTTWHNKKEVYFYFS